MQEKTKIIYKVMSKNLVMGQTANLYIVFMVVLIVWNFKNSNLVLGDANYLMINEETSKQTKYEMEQQVQKGLRDKENVPNLYEELTPTEEDKSIDNSTINNHKPNQGSGKIICDYMESSADESVNNNINYMYEESSSESKTSTVDNVFISTDNTTNESLISVTTTENFDESSVTKSDSLLNNSTDAKTTPNTSEIDAYINNQQEQNVQAINTRKVHIPSSIIEDAKILRREHNLDIEPITAEKQANKNKTIGSKPYYVPSDTSSSNS